MTISEIEWILFRSKIAEIGFDMQFLMDFLFVEFILAQDKKRDLPTVVEQ